MAAPRAARIARQMNVRWRSAELICEAFTYIAKIELNGLEAGPLFGSMERDVSKASDLSTLVLSAVAATCSDLTHTY